MQASSRQNTPLLLLLFIILPLLLITLVGFSNAYAVSSHRLRFEHLTMDDGLASNRVQAIVQDDMGFLWIGTQAGLSRFDGSAFKRYLYDPIDPTSISGDYIVFMLVDRSGTLWVGTNSDGLNRYDRYTDGFVRYRHNPKTPNSLTHNGITGLAEDSDGILWIGTWAGGLNRLNTRTGQFTSYRHDPNDPESLSSDRVWSVLVTRSGDVWAGTGDRGLNRMNRPGGGFTRFVHQPDDVRSISGDSIFSLIEDHTGAIWIGTEGKGLNRFDPKRSAFVRYRHDPTNPMSLGHDTVRIVYEDRNHQLWLGTTGGGLQRYDRETGIFHRSYHRDNDPESLVHDSVFAVHEDKGGLLWIGTQGGGVSWLNPERQRFVHIASQPIDPAGLSHKDVTALFEARDGEVWVGSLNGVDRLSPELEIKHRYRHDSNDPNALGPGELYLGIAEDSSGDVWIVSWGAGLYRFDRSTNRMVRYRPMVGQTGKTLTKPMTSVAVDNQGLVWIGTWGSGVMHFDPNTRQAMPLAQRLQNGSNSHSVALTMSKHIAKMRYDDHGVLWIATLEGLFLFVPETGELKAYRYNRDDPNSLHHTHVTTTLQTKSSGVWVGTKGKGIHRFDPRRVSFEVYTESSGLSSNMVVGGVEDNQGKLWITTTRGLNRFDPETQTFRRYDRASGLVSESFEINTIIKTRSGMILAGSDNGLIAFEPKKFGGDSKIPRVVLTDFQLFNQPVPLGSLRDGRTLLTRSISYTDQIVLSYLDTLMSFEFAALDFAYPHKHQYAYQLVGFDKGWNYSGTRQHATFTGLPPGSYTLQVKASNHEGKWNDQTTSVRLIVTPPFWRTWWFYFMVAALLISAVLGIHKYRIRAISLRNRQLQQEVERQTIDLRRQKTTLETTLKQLHHTKDEMIANAHKAGMADIAAGALHSVGNSLTSVRVASGLIRSELDNDVVAKLTKLNEMIAPRIDTFEQFYREDARGPKALRYLQVIEEKLKKEQRCIDENLSRTTNKVNEITSTISALREYAKQGEGLYEEIHLAEFIEQTLTFQFGRPEQRELTVNTTWDARISTIRTQKAKLTYILSNIFKNAIEALEEVPQQDRCIQVKTRVANEKAFIDIIDNGPGISTVPIEKIFHYGFTTKPKAHGFGLHSCGNYATEIGGVIEAANCEQGPGARFTIALPLKIKRLFS